MATPVQDTPVLTGKNARQFDTWLSENKNKKITESERARIAAASKKFKLVNV